MDIQEREKEEEEEREEPVEEQPTLRRILKAAKKEFLEKGYRSSGLRGIAKNAGVTTGALYGYFENKEELLDTLVSKQYHYILDSYKVLLNRFFALSDKEQKENLLPLAKEELAHITDYIYEYHDEFKLILCHSEGTEYCHLVHELAKIDGEAVKTFAKTTKESSSPLKEINPILEHMLMSGMFSTYFELIVHDIPREEATEYTSQMLEFYFGGFTKILGI